MSNVKHIGRVGALAVALGVGNVRRAATRMTVSIGVAVLAVMATVVSTPTVAPEVRLAASSPPCTRTDVTCALILGGTSIPTPDAYYVETVRNQFIAPTHPGQIGYDAVTTPEELWPLTGVGRLLGLALGPPELAGLGGPAWPDEPWWKLSGLFDLTGDQSLQAGVADLEDAMAEHPNDRLVIFGYSQGAGVANVEKRKLAEQYPAGTPAPDIDFVLIGDPNLPNGGWMARFVGLYIPILDLSFNGPAPTDTQFDTVEITHQYDGFADFPLYPLNVISLLNAVLGIVYVHAYPFDVSLPVEPTKSPAYQGTHGDTSYYFFETQDLPLFGPLRTLGVPESVIDVVEPFFKVIVELGYDRSIDPWEPTPARLIPPLNPATVTGDLVNAVGEDITNAAVLIGAPPLLSSPAPAATADQDAAMEQNFSGPGTTLQPVSHEVGDGVSRVLTAVGPQLPEPFAVSQDDLQASQRKVSREQVATNHPINETNGAVKSVIGNGRTIVHSARSDNGSQAPTASPAHKTPVRDAVKQASSDISRAVSNVSDSIEQAVGGAKHDGNDGDSGEGAAPFARRVTRAPGVERSRAAIS
jgi:PE-PPE domain